MTLTDNIKDRIKGCIYGQAIGDALGLGSEFMTQEEVKKNYPTGLKNYEQIIQDAHRRRWSKGSWTDDTDMMLCIAEARKDNRFDPYEVAKNFKKWFSGRPMGIGRSTYDVLCIADYVEIPYQVAEYMWQFSGCKNAANGALMRTSILGTSPYVTEEDISDICRLTHYDPRCVGSCVILSRLIQEMVFIERELSENEIMTLAEKYDNRICEYIVRSRDEDPSRLKADDEAMGYTLKTLAIALWCFWYAKDFTEGLLTVVNLGGDADTNAAVACSLLGAKFGFSTIPQDYIDNLLGREILEKVYQNTIADLMHA